ncbi:capreomycidine synthase [Kibdelosporangium aridum]|uniref:Capreomycidine synthase n=1 Tax=Kibdelosporangium aridum TaxID=2030 RepID=A0A428Z0T2_KIBAR|nr:capreomycidine synthase [Kibdelosporangium aridum]RSM78010.1 capreomycidine synthase [Kibdelosporangium aridum]
MSSPALSGIKPARLEDWFRYRYFDADIDVSSSGVQNYSVAEILRIAGVPAPDLTTMVMRDSPSVGAHALRAAIADRFAPGHDECVAVTHGSSEAIFLALAVLVRPGDEIITVRPAYHSLSGIAEALGATVHGWDLDSANGFQPDFDQLARLITKRTRVVIVNFPHNPTGTTLDTEAFRRLLDTVDHHGCHLLWDAACGELTYDAPPLPDPHHLIGNCVSFGTLSKAYGLPGLRVGWSLAPPELITEMVRLRDYVTLATSPLNELIATAVLRNADAVVGPRLAQAAHNRQALRTWLAANPGLFSCVLPAGGVSAFPRVGHPVDVDSCCTRLADEHGVLVVPGSCFGHPDRFRLGFGGDTGEFEKGLAELARFFRAEADRQR